MYSVFLAGLLCLSVIQCVTILWLAAKVDRAIVSAAKPKKRGPSKPRKARTARAVTDGAIPSTGSIPIDLEEDLNRVLPLPGLGMDLSTNRGGAFADASMSDAGVVRQLAQPSR